MLAMINNILISHLAYLQKKFIMKYTYIFEQWF